MLIILFNNLDSKLSTRQLLEFKNIHEPVLVKLLLLIVQLVLFFNLYCMKVEHLELGKFKHFNMSYQSRSKNN